MTDQELVDQLDEVWHSIAGLGADLGEAEWKTPTEVPGWTVQDNLTHVTALEWRLLGRADPDHELTGDPPHVKNDFGRVNEVFVDSRRGLSGAAALTEFEEVTAQRLATLRGSTPADFAAESWTPTGPGTVRDLLPFRIFDSWVHEQDMRRAVGRPGHLTGSVADAAMGRIVGSMPYVIGKRAAAPDGATVVFELAAPLPGTYAFGVDGRAHPVDVVPAAPTVRLRSDGEIFARLACGRIDPAGALADGRVVVDGDAELGRRVVEHLNFLF
jgi:uncharacterized protein (TIGR03083 family)